MKKEEKNKKQILEKGSEIYEKAIEYWQYPVDFIGVTNYPHQGQCIDFGWNSDNGGQRAPIHSIGDGTVIIVRETSYNGKQIFIQHNNGIISGYTHLSSQLVKVGQSVKRGYIIGNMGNTGSGANGQYHLHFGLFKSTADLDTATYNPFDYLYVDFQQSVAISTLNKYNQKIRYYNFNGDSTNIKYVYNADDEGLYVRKSAGGEKTGSLLETATKVNVKETSGGWSRIGQNQWVYSANLSNTCPTFYVVKGADSEGLYVRNQPNTSGKILNTLKNGSRVQIYATSGTWAKVSKDEARWCSKNYLSLGN